MFICGFVRSYTGTLGQLGYARGIVIRIEVDAFSCADRQLLTRVRNLPRRHANLAATPAGNLVSEYILLFSIVNIIFGKILVKST